jgi:hypothetical protein
MIPCLLTDRALGTGGGHFVPINVERRGVVRNVRKGRKGRTGRNRKVLSGAERVEFVVINVIDWVRLGNRVKS